MPALYGNRRAGCGLGLMPEASARVITDDCFSLIFPAKVSRRSSFVRSFFIHSFTHFALWGTFFSKRCIRVGQCLERVRSLKYKHGQKFNPRLRDSASWLPLADGASSSNVHWRERSKICTRLKAEKDDFI